MIWMLEIVISVRFIVTTFCEVETIDAYMERESNNGCISQILSVTDKKECWRDRQ